MSSRAAWRLTSLGFGDVRRYVAGKQDWFAAGLPREGEQAKLARVMDVVRCDVPVCRIDDRIGAVRDRVRAAGWDTCVVTTDDRIVLGRIPTEAFAAAPDTPVETLMESGPSTFRPDRPLPEMVEYMYQHGDRTALITDQDGRLIGILQRERAERGLAGVTRAAETAAQPA